jgi:hypothetical protein
MAPPPATPFMQFYMWCVAFLHGSSRCPRAQSLLSDSVYCSLSEATLYSSCTKLTRFWSHHQALWFPQLLDCQVEASHQAHLLTEKEEVKALPPACGVAANVFVCAEVMWCAMCFTPRCSALCFML